MQERDPQLQSKVKGVEASNSANPRVCKHVGLEWTLEWGSALEGKLVVPIP